MRYTWSFAALLLSTLYIPQALTEGTSDQQALFRQSPLEPLLDDKKLSDVIATSSLLSLHRAICEVESVTDNELVVGELVIATLEAHNFTVKRQSVPPPGATNSTKERFNVYAYPDISKYDSASHVSIDGEPATKPKVLLSSHIDTVPPHIPYSLALPKSLSSREDIMIMGRGTVDDKACVAVQIQTAIDLLSTGEVSPSDLALLFVVGEEKRGDGMHAFSDSELYKATNENYKAILFGEPTEKKLATGHKGIISKFFSEQLPGDWCFSLPLLCRSMSQRLTTT